jgi:hypothetical protein
MRNPGITRQMRDLDRLKTIQAVVDRELKPGRAAEHRDAQIKRRLGFPKYRLPIPAASPSPIESQLVEHDQVSVIYLSARTTLMRLLCR